MKKKIKSLKDYEGKLGVSAGVAIKPKDRAAPPPRNTAKEEARRREKPSE